MCGLCARRASGLAKRGVKLKGDNMRHYRVCCVCNDMIQVTTAKHARTKYCRNHAPKKTLDTGRVKAKFTPRKKKEVSPQAIEKARQINKEHREAIGEQKKLPDQLLLDREFVSIWLQNNEITVIPTLEELYMSSGRGLGEHSSMVGGTY